MIQYEKYTLPNGLKVIIHTDIATPIIAFNLMYNVGARDEDPNKTGFAHLFEHLMFGGSKNIPDFDKPLQERGGTSNAFTNNDITNYYVTIPKENLETAFWLDSDRMLELAFSPKSLEVQRNVVIEEFKQRYLNQPYGDVWLKMRPLAYKVHPYQWATIGKEISHIENATMDDVKNFFYSHYAPNNAILCVAGNITRAEIEPLVEKWFGDIPSRKIKPRNLPVEPTQTEKRLLETGSKVPANAIYKAWHMAKRNSPEFYPTDLITDILSRGKSSRLTQELIKEQKLFSEINAYITGDLDEGLLIVSGKLNNGVSFETANASIETVLEKVKSVSLPDEELEKVKNKWMTHKLFDDMNVLNKAMNLCYYELLGDTSLYEAELEKYKSVTSLQIKQMAGKVLQPSNCSTIYYAAQ
ncbi:MAG TPA: pitrilysin family protein [Flavobacteriales bacterium]|nr:pitrilysin family protein [Flavobacteriales bacterium]